MKSQFTSADLAKTFMLGGRARLTLVSEKTRARFTYRIVQKTPDMPWFVQLLSGADNEGDYQFLGSIFKGEEVYTYRHGRKSRISPQAPSARAFEYAAPWLLMGALPPRCQVWHEGRCGKCGRALTVPESISRGLGPECFLKQ